MPKVDNEIVHTQLNWRYACKKFDPIKKIRDADWNVLVESLRLSASSYGLQPWKFIVVQDPDLRVHLQKAAWGQTPVVDASHFIVITYKENVDETHIDRHVSHTAKVQGVELTSLERYKRSMMKDLVHGTRAEFINYWAQQQTYIALGSFLTTAAFMEIDALPMEGFDPPSFDRILGLDGTGYKSVTAIAAGYRAADDRFQNIKKIRFDLPDVIEYK